MIGTKTRRGMAFVAIAAVLFMPLGLAPAHADPDYPPSFYKITMWTGAILAAVVLLFHQQEELVQSPEAGAVAIVIICQRFAEPDCGDPAFVGEEVAHAWEKSRVTRR